MPLADDPTLPTEVEDTAPGRLGGTSETFGLRETGIKRPEVLSPEAMKAVSPSVTEANALGEITADSAGIGASAFGAPMASDAFVTPQTETPDVLSSSYLPEAQAPTEGTWQSAVVAAARQYLGTPYVWGGTSPSGFDCSGLVQYIYAQQGINLPRISADQANAGKRVSLDDLQVGDLVAWDNSSRNNGADHIAIYIGNGRIIEAPRPGAAVQVSTIYDSGNAWGVRIAR